MASRQAAGRSGVQAACRPGRVWFTWSRDGPSTPFRKRCVRSYSVPDGEGDGDGSVDEESSGWARSWSRKTHPVNTMAATRSAPPRKINGRAPIRGGGGEYSGARIGSTAGAGGGARTAADDGSSHSG